MHDVLNVSGASGITISSVASAHFIHAQFKKRASGIQLAAVLP
jgi:hypothetical protein